jgi:methylmalonyl-CoA mutase cobalamin-binding subunit
MLSSLVHSVLICILADYATLTLSEVIDKCQKAGVNLKKFGRLPRHDTPFKPLHKTEKKITFCGDMAS